MPIGDRGSAFGTMKRPGDRSPVTQHRRNRRLGRVAPDLSRWTSALRLDYRRSIGRPRALTTGRVNGMDHEQPPVADAALVAVLGARDGQLTDATLHDGRAISFLNVAWGYDLGERYAHITTNVSPRCDELSVDFFYSSEVVSIADPPGGAILWQTGMALSATPSQRLLIEACLDNGVPFFWRGPGTLLIAQTGMGALLPAIAAAGASVIGFEGFEMESADIHPRLDLVFEAARRPDISNPASAISDWPADIWIDVALRLPGSAAIKGLN